MTTEEMSLMAEEIQAKGGLLRIRKWTDLVLHVIKYLGKDITKGVPCVEIEKSWVECVAISRVLAPISMKTWSTGYTLDFLDKTL